MNILIVTTYYSPYKSGMSEYAKILAEGLAKRGHKVTVLTSRFRRDLHENETVNRVIIRRIPVLMKISKGVIMPTFVSELRRLSRDNDMVNLHAPMFEVWLAAKAVPKEKIVVTYHCDLNLRNKFIEGVYYFFLNKAMEKVKSIVVNNLDYLRNSSVKEFASKAVEVIPPVKEGMAYRNPERLKKSLGLSKEKLIGFLGRLVEEKGVEYLINSSKFIKGKDFRILIAGSGNVAGGSLEKELKQLAKKYPEKILFIGEIPENKLTEFYSMLDVFVLPSVNSLESFGLTQIEAMLCGCPVIASDLDGVRKPVSLTGMGLIVKHGDSKEIGKAINKILEDRKRFTKSRLEISNAFDNEKFFERYERILTRE